jgi:ABC-type transport system involved in cytochrome c biogenesis permease subunit
MNKIEQFAPWIVVGLAAIYLLAMMAPPAESANNMRLDEFAALPLEDDGRVKPYDTLARTSLMIISGKQTFVDENKNSQPAIRWLLDVMTSGPMFQEAADKQGGPRFSLAGLRHRVFRIDNPEVVALLGLKRREGSRFSYLEMQDRFDKLDQESKRIEQKDVKTLTPYEKGVHDLVLHVKLFLKLANWMKSLYVLPPTSADDDWQTFQEASAEADIKTAAAGVPTIVTAYAHNDAKAFNDEVESFRKQLNGQRDAEVKRGEVETFFNHFEPFFQCSILYVFVFLLACFSWLAAIGSSLSGSEQGRNWWQPLRRAALWLAVLTLVFHTAALLTRIYLQGRPPVTNLYSSAVFIGWGCVGLCLVLERLFPISVGNAVAGFCGAATMFVAHYLGSDGDTMALLQPVLDTNFWLATHVTCVTLGYVATFVAGFLGIVYITAGVLTPYLNRSLSKILSQMLYGVICFATLLSFTGTVLGGIWADQSWGRFWGWDPKENGALLIVIWNALILHARWGGMIKQRGMAVLAVVGNIVTGWSWFGTNQLGVGLHAYGFNDTLAVGLVIFWATQAAVICLGLLPLHLWASHKALTAAPHPIEPVAPPRTEKPSGKRRGRRHPKRGDAGFFPGPA